jgi:hypothetical protein
MHPVRRSDSVANTIRLRRLRILLKDVANQIVQGGAPAQIESDLQTINLTAPAARRLVSLAKVKAFTQDMLPPYENRWLAYGLALAFIATCIIVVGRNNPPEGYTNYALAVSGWLAGDIARPKRRPRSRLS